MWATYPKMQEALDLIEAWGFKYKSIAFQWIKQNRSGNGYFFGLGRWTRGNTEPCLIAIKGKPKRISAGVGQLVFSPLRRHSQMNQTTKETRRRSYDAVLPKRAARCRLILETLGNRELTASEITEELVAAGRIPYFNRNYVAPRLTELKEIGILTTVGRRKATRSDATEAVWARAEPSGPTGQTAAAYADNPTEAEQMTLGSAT